MKNNDVRCERCGANDCETQPVQLPKYNEYGKPVYGTVGLVVHMCEICRDAMADKNS